MKETINLYNHFHNGDLFYSRPAILGLSEKFKINFYHNMNGKFFQDIDGLNEINGVPPNFGIHTTDLKNKIVNLWIGQSNMVYINKTNHGCSFENHMFLANEICEYYGINITNHEKCLPFINYEKLINYDLVKTKMEDYKKTYKSIIFISNGNVNSGQSVNFSLSSIIQKLCLEFSDSLILITEKIEHLKFPNLVYTGDITNIFPDLLLNGFISTYSDIIVGRASGPYCFAQNSTNLLDENKTFIAFCNNINEGRFYEKQKSKFLWTNNYTFDNMYGLIKSII